MGSQLWTYSRGLIIRGRTLSFSPTSCWDQTPRSGAPLMELLQHPWLKDVD